ncbi:hypothetical protein CC79DRAFT_186105 [Sarocladium strictum]
MGQSPGGRPVDGRLEQVQPPGQVGLGCNSDGTAQHCNYQLHDTTGHLMTIPMPLQSHIRPLLVQNKILCSSAVCFRKSIRRPRSSAVTQTQLVPRLVSAGLRRYCAVGPGYVGTHLPYRLTLLLARTLSPFQNGKCQAVAFVRIIVSRIEGSPKINAEARANGTTVFLSAYPRCFSRSGYEIPMHPCLRHFICLGRRPLVSGPWPGTCFFSMCAFASMLLQTTSLYKSHAGFMQVVDKVVNT